MARYFGTNGVRGRFDELTPALALGLAQAIGTFFKARNKRPETRIIVARDCRLTGEALRCAVASGLASVGCGVIDLGIASSPTAEFMVKKLRADGCIIITASHNPPEWNALKVVDSGGIAVSWERGEEIEELLGKAALVPWDKVGRIEPHDSAEEAHIEEIMRHVDSQGIAERKPKIAVDCGNGTTATIIPRLLKALGCEILSLNSHQDGRFPGRPSEPTEANVKELMALVRSSDADAGIAWDGDGDRVVFVDEKGGYVIGDRVYALSLLWKAEKEKVAGRKPQGDVVTTVATSKAVEDVASKLGLKTRYTAIGAPYLSEEVEKGDAFMGGEEVGGVIWPELSLAKDGILTAAKLAEALCKKPLTKWLGEVPIYHNVKIRIEADKKAKEKIVSRVLAHAEGRKLPHITVDGVRINFKDSWVIVRASGTENYVRIFAEAKTEAEAKRLVQEYGKIAKGA
jgi:phosphomannomutase/phosphoglucomutase